MKRKSFCVIFIVIGLCWLMMGVPANAQKPLNTLTLLYSNNINGEIEPCPT